MGRVQRYPKSYGVWRTATPSPTCHMHGPVGARCSFLASSLNVASTSDADLTSWGSMIQAKQTAHLAMLLVANAWWWRVQAMDRCHRIGQQKPVLVLRLATAHSVEGKLLKRARSKLALERLVIKKGAFLPGETVRIPRCQMHPGVSVLQSRAWMGIFSSFCFACCCGRVMPYTCEGRSSPLRARCMECNPQGSSLAD